MDHQLNSMLEEHFLAAAQVSIDDIHIFSLSRIVREVGVELLKESFLERGILGSVVSLYILSPEEQASKHRRYGLIDGAHRLFALTDLIREFPDNNFPTTVNARIYQSLSPQQITLFSGMLNQAPASIGVVHSPSLMDSLTLLRFLMEEEEDNSSIPDCATEERFQRTMQHFTGLGYTIPHYQLLVTDGFFEWAGDRTLTYLWVLDDCNYDGYLQVGDDFPQYRVCDTSEGYLNEVFTENMAREYRRVLENEPQMMKDVLLFRIVEHTRDSDERGTSPSELVSSVMTALQRSISAVAEFCCNMELLEQDPSPEPFKISDLDEDGQNACMEELFVGDGSSDLFREHSEIRAENCDARERRFSIRSGGGAYPREEDDEETRLSKRRRLMD